MSESVNFIQGRKEQYNPSEMQGGLFFSKDSKEILLNGESYGNATPADEEDITAEDGNLKLKDRAYDEANFSGKGYKILRKNIQQVTVPKFDLTISTGCTANGNITINEISIEVTTEASTPEAVAQLIQLAISGTTISGAVVTFTSNPTIDYSTTGVSGQVVDNSYQENRNILTQDMINEPNTRYVIQYDFDLNEQEITIPGGCILDFQGGSLNNGALIGIENNEFEFTGDIKCYCLFSNIKNESLDSNSFIRNDENYIDRFLSSACSNCRKVKSVLINKDYIINSSIECKYDININGFNHTLNIEENFSGKLLTTTEISNNIFEIVLS